MHKQTGPKSNSLRKILKADCPILYKLGRNLSSIYIKIPFAYKKNSIHVLMPPLDGIHHCLESNYLTLLDYHVVL